MGRHLFPGFVFIICLVIAFTNAKAESTNEGRYLLPKAGIMAISLNNSDPLISVGLLYGVRLTETSSFESELNYGFSGGAHTKIASSGGASKGEYRITTLAGYGVYRLPLTDHTYLKGKLGLLFEDILRNVENDSTVRNNDLGVAGGIGMGSQFAEMATVELEATIIDKNIIFYSIGAHFQF